MFNFEIDFYKQAFLRIRAMSGSLASKYYIRNVKIFFYWLRYLYFKFVQQSESTFLKDNL